MQPTLPLSGGCACGKIRYECTALPLFVFQCHCRDCQRATGGPFAPNAWFAIGSIRFQVEPKSYVVRSDAGNTVHHEFCADCGSPIGMRIEQWSGGRGVRASSLDDPSWLSLDANIFTRNAYPWETMNPALVEYKNQPPGEFVQELIARRSG